MHQHARALNVPEEVVAKTRAFRRSLDQAGDIRQHQGMIFIQGSHAQLGFQRGEGIVGDLGAGRAHTTHQGALACVGEARQPHIGDELELELYIADLAILAGLGVAGRAVGAALEVVVAQTTATAPTDADLLAVLHQFGEHLAAGGIPE